MRSSRATPVRPTQTFGPFPKNDCSSKRRIDETLHDTPLASALDTQLPISTTRYHLSAFTRLGYTCDVSR